MAIKDRLFDENLTDVEIACKLAIGVIEGNKHNVDLVKRIRIHANAALKELYGGKPASKIIEEVRLNAFRKN